ncbi:MAG: PilN domain-containing protein [Mariprofundaceae bacterium]|nr:PilN domain-containing protein [Mariprofundaceae bacterium]
MFVADLIKTSELATLEESLSELKAQNAALQKKIGKIKDLDNLRADVERKLELVEELQQGRFHTLMTLNQLATVIPENVWLQSIADKEGTITINGLGESNKAVANFMRALDQETIFSNISLSKITRTNIGNIPVRSFSLTMNRVTEEVQKEPGESGK